MLLIFPTPMIVMHLGGPKNGSLFGPEFKVQLFMLKVFYEYGTYKALIYNETSQDSMATWGPVLAHPELKTLNLGLGLLGSLNPLILDLDID